MRHTPEVLDYEGVFPSKRPRPGEGEPVRKPIFKEPVLDQPAQDSAPPLTNADGSPSFMALEAGQWQDKRGHSLTFAFLFLFSVILYFRPYEMIPALSSFKTMAFYTGIITLAIYFVSQMVLEGNLTSRPREVNMVLLMGLAALLSIPFAIDPSEAWSEFVDLAIKTILIFLVLVNVLRTELRVKMLFWLVLAVSIYLSVNVIKDYQAGIFKLGAAEQNTQRVAGSIKNLFDNSNDLALHLVTMIPISIALALEKKNPLRKVVFFGIALLMISAVIITFSRGGFIGLIAVTLVLVRKLGRRNKSTALAALVLGIIFFIVVAPGSYSGRLATIFDSASDITGSSSQRTQVLKRSVLVALRYPIFGVGLGNFHHKSFQELGTHNAYTQVAAETGIAAMVCYIIFLVHPLRKLRMIERQLFERNENSRFYYLSIGLQASLVGFMVASFFAAVAYQWYVYYLVAYAIALRRIYYLEEAKKVSQLNHG
ncbi:MAG TPA: O-antigen ligase family protein [Pyrinomonadaceae bacterium]|nr:O-antigen ligase family protein [Pyrinomonadaceae bacterium]